MGLNVSDDPPRARAFVRRYGWRWPSIRDPARVRAKRLGASWQPAYIAIDRRGRIVGRRFNDGERERAWSWLVRRLIVT